MRRLLAVAAIALFTLTACGNNATPATAPPVAPASTTASTTAPTTDEAGARACKLLSTTVDKTELADDADTVNAILRAAKDSTHDTIREAGETLGDKYRLAVVSKGSEDEVSTSIDVVTAAAEMSTACIKARLDTE